MRSPATAARHYQRQRLSTSHGESNQISGGVTTTAASIIFVLGGYCYYHYFDDTINTRRTQCEEKGDKVNPQQQPSYSDPSWLRRKLASWNIMGSLPVPRLLRPNDPDLILSQRHVERRKKDEVKLRELLEDGIQSINQSHSQQRTTAPKTQQQLQEEQVALAKEINDKAMKITFGVDTQTRQQFLWVSQDYLVAVMICGKTI